MVCSTSAGGILAGALLPTLILLRHGSNGPDRPGHRTTDRSCLTKIRGRETKLRRVSFTSVFTPRAAALTRT